MRKSKKRGIRSSTTKVATRSTSEASEVDQIAQAMVENLNKNVARAQSVLNAFLRDAIALAIQTHEIDRKQKRKGKEVAYIVHPLTVGLILAKAGAWDHQITAGILHDVLEDSIAKKKVTVEMLRERFGPSVAKIVEDVTEQNRELSWKERKREALRHIQSMDGPSLWVKTADVISNVSELLDDYAADGDNVFLRFNAPMADVVANYRAVLDALIRRWDHPPHGPSDNPMVLDLKTLTDDLALLAR